MLGCLGSFLLGGIAGFLAAVLWKRQAHRLEEGLSGSLQRAPAHQDGLDREAARAAGFVVSGPDNLEVIEGIGPTIAALLRQNGVLSFAKLAGMTEPAIRTILEQGGPRFRIANPSTWAEQAALVTANRWEDLRALQDELDGGVRRHQAGRS